LGEEGKNGSQVAAAKPCHGTHESESKVPPREKRGPPFGRGMGKNQGAMARKRGGGRPPWCVSGEKPTTITAKKKKTMGVPGDQVHKKE